MEPVTCIGTTVSAGLAHRYLRPPQDPPPCDQDPGDVDVTPAREERHRLLWTGAPGVPGTLEVEDDADAWAGGDERVEVTPEGAEAILEAAKAGAPLVPGRLGMKFDGSKPALGLIPPYAMELAGAGFAIGAEKYAAWNWAKGLEYTKLAGALLRHLEAFLAREDMDEDTGLPHLAGVLCSAMMLADMTIRHPEMDDRLGDNGADALRVNAAICEVRAAVAQKLSALRASKEET